MRPFRLATSSALKESPLFYLLLASYLLLIMAALINHNDKAFLLMGLGFLLNFLVIAANGTMPVSLEVAARIASPEKASELAR